MKYLSLSIYVLGAVLNCAAFSATPLATPDQLRAVLSDARRITVEGMLIVHHDLSLSGDVQFFPLQCTLTEAKDIRAIAAIFRAARIRHDSYLSEGARQGRLSGRTNATITIDERWSFVVCGPRLIRFGDEVYRVNDPSIGQSSDLARDMALVLRRFRSPDAPPLQ